MAYPLLPLRLLTTHTRYMAGYHLLHQESQPVHRLAVHSPSAFVAGTSQSCVSQGFRRVSTAIQEASPHPTTCTGGRASLGSRSQHHRRYLRLVTLCLRLPQPAQTILDVCLQVRSIRPCAGRSRNNTPTGFSSRITWAVRSRRLGESGLRRHGRCRLR